MIVSSREPVLHQATTDIQPNELALAEKIAAQLYDALKPFFPAAGLAAPQIGVSRSVFIFSYDRDPAHLETVINPTYTPIGDERHFSWEGCLSVMACEWTLARLPRWEKINASWMNLDGKRVERILEGFAAKVFQHETDHLRGIVNIAHPDAEIKRFASKEEFDSFLQEAKKEDASRYRK